MLCYVKSFVVGDLGVWFDRRVNSDGDCSCKSPEESQLGVRVYFDETARAGGLGVGSSSPPPVLSVGRGVSSM